MIEMGIAQAKSHFSQLTAQVDGGEQVILTKRGRPAYQLISLRPNNEVRAVGPEQAVKTIPPAAEGVSGGRVAGLSPASQLQVRLANLASLTANDPVYPGSFVADMRRLDLL